MGSSFSIGIFESGIIDLIELPMEKVQGKHLKFVKLTLDEYQNNAFFITRDEFGKVYGYDPKKTLDTFKVWDPQLTGVATVLEVFGGMALASKDKVKWQKINKSMKIQFG